MSEFKAGDTAIYIGRVNNIYCAPCIAHGDEVTLVQYLGDVNFPAAVLRRCWLIGRRSINGKEIVVPESDLQKPPKPGDDTDDDFDIRDQQWYQNIINVPEQEPA